MLQVNTDLSIKDVIAGSIITYVTNKTQLVFVAAFSIYFTWIKIPPEIDILKPHVVSTLVFFAIKIFLSVLLFASIFAAITALLNTKMKRGVLGKHNFSFTDEDFTEVTDHNESKHRYTSVTNVLTITNYLIIQIAGSQYHIIPFRSFENDTQRDQLISILRDKLDKVANSV